MSGQYPFSAGWDDNIPPKKERGNELEMRLQQAIEQDPEIRDPTRISVTFEKGGLLKHDEIHLIGEVSSEKDRMRAEEIVRKNTKNDLDIHNEIHVSGNDPGNIANDGGLYI